MYSLQLAAIPNQTLSATLDGSSYELTLRGNTSFMWVDISRDGVQIVQGQLLVIEFPLIPYAYLQTGNFMLLSDAADSLPDYTAFGATQSLVYFTQAELAAL